MGFKPRWRRVCVHWDDAAVDPGWKDPSEEHRCSPRIHTVGYIVRDTSKHIEVAQSASQFGQVADVMLIPKGCIARIERL